MKEELMLVIPTKEYEVQAINLIEEVDKTDLNKNIRFSGFNDLENFKNNYEEWLEYIKKQLNKETVPQGYVTAHTFFTIRKSDNKLVGIINIRHELNEYLLNYGGHIGYSILPSERRKGYAKEMLRQLIEKFYETNYSVLGVQTVSKKDVCKYGNITPNSDIKNRSVEIKDLVEKPKVEEAKSQLAVLGRYVLTPTIFKYLETQERGKGNEIQLTDAIRRMLSEEKVYAYDFEGIRYDIGDKFGYVKAIIDFALKNPELKDKTEEYINSRTKQIN